MPGKDEIDFQFLVEHSMDIITHAGMDRIVKYVTPSIFHLLGWTPEERIGRMVNDLILPDDLPVFADAYERLLAPDAQTVSITLRVRRKDGSVVWIEANASLIRDPATGEPKEVVIVMRDVTERKMLEEKLAALALTDGLTGLANRRAFDQALKREWKRALRDGSQLSLLMLDLDHFKRFNDQYGHQMGDDCLRAVAAAANGAVRTTDTVARYGGEEFTVILPSTGATGGVATAEKVRAAIEAMRLTHDPAPQSEIRITASIGVATAFVRTGGTVKKPETLLKLADNALYKAKHEGRNRVVSSPHIDSADQ